MEYILIVVVAAIAFGIFYFLDKGFTKIFRNKAQHRTGLSVRLSKRYGSIGLVVAVLGVAAVFSGLSGNWLLLIGGGLLVLLGTGFVVYYMTFGVFYDDSQFVLTTFGKRSTTYSYKDICSQQLYNSYGNVIIELYLSDGRTVQLQSSMTGIYPFLDKAFEAWLVQTGRKREDCSFHDPENSCWFPNVEV